MAAQSAPESFAELDEAPELIMPGDYDLRFVYYETKRVFDRPKIFMWFSVITMGEYFEKRVPRYYGATRLLEKPQKSGKFKVGRKSDMFREFCGLFPVNARRLDRLPMSLYETIVVTGTVRTVNRGYNQRPIPPEAQYSVIEKLMPQKVKK